MYHQGITSIERFIIESIQRGNSQISQVLSDTQLGLNLVHNIVQNLIIRGVLIQQEKIIKINPNMEKSLEKEVYSKNLTQAEKKELALGLIKDGDIFKVKKFFLTDKDKVIFKSLLGQINEFIENLPNPPKNKNTSELTVMVWGTHQYHQVIESILK